MNVSGECKLTVLFKHCSCLLCCSLMITGTFLCNLYLSLERAFQCLDRKKHHSVFTENNLVGLSYIHVTHNSVVHLKFYIKSFLLVQEVAELVVLLHCYCTRLL